MDKKFVAAVAVCIVALVAVAAGTIFLGQRSSHFTTTDVDTVVSTEDDMQAAQKIVEQFEDEIETAADRVGPQEEVSTSSEGESKVVSANVGVDKNKETGDEINEEYRGLSSEAAAQIELLKFGKDSSLLWPVQGNIIIPFDMESTVYYSTLDEYKTSPGIVIQSNKGTAIKAATSGVITRIEESDELGVYIKQAIGNDYIATYGQITNPEVSAGDYVEAGQVIAYVGKPSSYYTKEGDNVYFSITKDGKAYDPLNYIDYED